MCEMKWNDNLSSYWAQEMEDHTPEALRMVGEIPALKVITYYWAQKNAIMLNESPNVSSNPPF
jgi:hypothetical protein